MEFPSKSWVTKALRYNLTKPLRVKVLKAFVIGSYVQGNQSSQSDLDIAVVISTKKTKSSLKFSENYHSHFTKENQKPKWQSVQVDFQFYYPDDKELFEIKKKIELL